MITTPSQEQVTGIDLSRYDCFLELYDTGGLPGTLQGAAIALGNTDTDLEIDNGYYTEAFVRNFTNIPEILHWSYLGVVEAAIAYRLGVDMRSVFGQRLECGGYIAGLAALVYEFGLSQPDHLYTEESPAKLLVSDMTLKILKTTNWINTQIRKGTTPTWEQAALNIGDLSNPSTTRKRKK